MFKNILNIDRYALTVTYAFYKQNKHAQISTCDMFYRKPPSEFPFIVNAGVWWALDYLRSLEFTPKDLDYIEENLNISDEGFKEFLSKFSYDKLKIDYMIEGEFAYPNTPILSVKSELGYVLLFEAPLLSIFNLCTAIATNALYYRSLARDLPIIEMGLRRAYGPEAAYLCSIYSVCSGINHSSNVIVSKEYGMTSKGTMSHAFILAFDNSDDFNDLSIPDKVLSALKMTRKGFLTDLHKRRKSFGCESTSNGELKAFLSFMFSFNTEFAALIDTFDTLSSGLKNYALVASYVSEMGIKNKGIRLDSGDLIELSLQCRKYLKDFDKQFGYNLATETNILASSDIDGKFLKQLTQNQHEINSLGIGTKLVTFKNIESVGMVYKLVDVEGTPKMKFSSELIKANVPARKKLYKVHSGGKRYHLVMRYDEELKPGEMVAFRRDAEKGDYSPETIVVEEFELLVRNDVIPDKFDAMACKNRIDKNYKEMIDDNKHIECVLYSAKLQDIVAKSHALVKAYTVTQD